MALARALRGLTLCTIVSALAADSTLGDAPAPLTNFVRPDLKHHVCTAPANCSAIPHATCDSSSSRCSCLAGYSPVGNAACGTNLGDSCNETKPCDARNSTCEKESRKCTCVLGFQGSRDGTFCYGLPLFHRDTCEHDGDCTSLGENVHCHSRTCVCRENYTWSYGSGTCKKKIGALGAECNATTQECYEVKNGDADSRRDCINGVCQCKPQFAAANGTCREKMMFPNTACSSSNPCNISYAFCNDVGRCECSEGYSQMNNTACGHIVGDKCYDDVCHANNTRCHNDECRCRPAYETNYNGTFCFKAPTEFGDLCNTTANCPDFGDGRECRDGRCICQIEFAFDYKSQTCKYKIDELGRECNDNQICYLERDGDNQKAECIEGTCQCRYKTSKDKQSCSGATALLASTSGLLIMLLAKILA